MKPRLLDLFCGAGGAARGYQLAGFHVTGVDCVDQPRYAGDEFVRGDALKFLAFHYGEFDAIHASPPCQSYSVTASLHTVVHPRLIAPVRDAMIERYLRVPYVIENVQGARRYLHNPIRLCGSSFGLGVRRHRLFELSFPTAPVPSCAHHLQPEPIDVTGTGGPAARKPGGGGGIHRKPRNLAHAQEVMGGIDWMTRRELSQAIPPAYSRWIGDQLIAQLTVAA